MNFFEKLLDLPSQNQISSFLDLDPTQDSFRYRAKEVALKLSFSLIDDKGQLQRENLKELIHFFEKTPFLVNERRENDLLYLSHIQRCLYFLENDREIEKKLSRFTPPFHNKQVTELIQESLFPQKVKKVTATDAKRAVLAAWLTPLRQVVGSCFATSLAINIQKHEPLLFFQDLLDLLQTGQLKRVVDAKQRSVPINLRYLGAELFRPAHGFEGSFVFSYALMQAGIEVNDLIREKVKQKGLLSVEGALKEAILTSLDLSEEEIKEEELSEKLQMDLFLARNQGYFYQKPTARREKVLRFRKALEIATLSLSSLSDSFLLRVWEFTLASFCDVKTEFTRYNLFIALGMHPEEKGGIGAILYEEISKKIRQIDKRIEELQEEALPIQSAIDALQMMLRGASSDRYERIKADLNAQGAIFDRLYQEKILLSEKKQVLVHTFGDLIDQYIEKFAEEFQELFDPQIHEKKEGIFEDSPAGFRLFYKHGRQDASNWSGIYSKEEFLETLRTFFSSIENQIRTEDPELIRELTDGLIAAIRREEFFLSCLERVHKKGRAFPWQYISGGTLDNLLRAYFQDQIPFFAKSIRPKNIEELFTFLSTFEKKQDLLITSPTHAFTFFSGRLKKKPTAFPHPLFFSKEGQSYLIERIGKELPSQPEAALNLQHQQNPFESDPQAFYKMLIASSSQRRKWIDAKLFSLTPVFEKEQIPKQILHLIDPRWQTQDHYCPMDLFHLVKKSFLLKQKRAFLKEDFDLALSKKLEELKLKREAILFADTNWSFWQFGLTLHPVLETMQLWRFDRIGLQGAPMDEWDKWFDPKNQGDWIVYNTEKSSL